MPAATSHELIVTIVRMLAEAADRSRLTNADQDLLNKKVEELMAYDSDESVRDILRALKHRPIPALSANATNGREAPATVLAC